MSVIQHLLRRWGFVKLRRYGLELTSDGRILSTRSAVLDDGTGGRIVGWHDGDVSIWKLSRIDREVPAIPAVSAPVRPSARVMPVEVAGDVPVEEDDWEWSIALARARVAVEETESAVPPEPSPPLRTSMLIDPASLAAMQIAPVHPERGAPPPVAPPPAPVTATITAPAAPPPPRPTPRTMARTAALASDPAASSEWPATAPIGSIDYEDYRVSQTREIPRAPRPTPAPPTIAIPRTTTPGTVPSTVIPVPTLPTVDATRASWMEPVVRSSSASQSAASRLAKGTAPLEPDAPRTTRRQAMVLDDTNPNLSVGDRTRPGIGAPFAPDPTEPNLSLPPMGDRTRPGIALPSAARAVSLPSIKRRSAPR